MAAEALKIRLRGAAGSVVARIRSARVHDDVTMLSSGGRVTGASKAIDLIYAFPGPTRSASAVVYVGFASLRM